LRTADEQASVGVEQVGADRVGFEQRGAGIRIHQVGHLHLAGTLEQFLAGSACHRKVGKEGCTQAGRAEILPAGFAGAAQQVGQLEFREQFTYAPRVGARFEAEELERTLRRSRRAGAAAGAEARQAGEH